MEEFLPLIPQSALIYYNNAQDLSTKDYHKSIDLRLCLEEICREFLYKFFPEDFQNEWKKKNLNEQLISLKKFMDHKVINRVMTIKRIGNKAAHEGIKAKANKATIESSLKTIQDFSIEIFVAYFKRFGFHNSNDFLWGPTIISTLPPIYRIKIFEKYIKFNNELLIIDKLSMAYLKNYEEKKAIAFLKECLNNKYIDEDDYYNLIEKLQILSISLERFPIAKNIEESKKNFTNLLSIIPKEQRKSLCLIMSLILLPEELKE